MKTKEEMLEELQALGVDPVTGKPPRKARSDAGASRAEYKPRNDIGKSRSVYTRTAAKYKAIYEKMLTNQLVDGTEEGADNLTRDKNSIFPPNLIKISKLIKLADREYITNAIKPAHLEQARWRWLMAEFATDPDKWRDHISKWYFIKPDEIESWTYTEWAWAYVYHISGEENRLTAHPLVLSYEDYVKGLYNGHPDFDKRGDIIWPK